MSDRLRQRENEAERARARLDLQLEALQSRMSLESLADDAVGALRRSRYGGVIDDCFDAVRRNPVPALLAGAAVAFLVLQIRDEQSRRKSRFGIQRGDPMSSRTAGDVAPLSPPPTDAVNSAGPHDATSVPRRRSAA